MVLVSGSKNPRFTGASIGDQDRSLRQAGAELTWASWPADHFLVLTHAEEWLSRFLAWRGWMGSCGGAVTGEDAPVRHWFPLFVFILVASCQQTACPSPPGGKCDPRNFNCPGGYTCSLAEICTRKCESVSECWVKVEEGCRGIEYPGMRLPDGGTFMETSDEGFCPESRTLACVQGYCQPGKCADDGCDYDLYGPSEYKGNREQGPDR